jgi:hypothetical protein
MDLGNRRRCDGDADDSEPDKNARRTAVLRLLLSDLFQSLSSSPSFLALHKLPPDLPGIHQAVVISGHRLNRGVV